MLRNALQRISTTALSTGAAQQAGRAALGAASCRLRDWKGLFTSAPAAEEASDSPWQGIPRHQAEAKLGRGGRLVLSGFCWSCVGFGVRGLEGEGAPSTISEQPVSAWQGPCP